MGWLLKGPHTDSPSPGLNAEVSLWKVPRIHVKETHFLILKWLGWGTGACWNTLWGQRLLGTSILLSLSLAKASRHYFFSFHMDAIFMLQPMDTIISPIFFCLFPFTFFPLFFFFPFLVSFFSLLSAGAILAHPLCLTPASEHHLNTLPLPCSRAPVSPEGSFYTYVLYPNFYKWWPNFEANNPKKFFGAKKDHK